MRQSVGFCALLAAAITAVSGIQTSIRFYEVILLRTKGQETVVQGSKQNKYGQIHGSLKLAFQAPRFTNITKPSGSCHLLSIALLVALGFCSGLYLGLR